MIKIKKLYLIAFVSTIVALTGCGAANEKEEQPEEEIIADESETAIEDTSKEENAQTKETENTSTEAELTFVEVKPILDNLDDVWGKNWLEWTLEDFANEYDVPINSVENNEVLPSGVGVKTAWLTQDGAFTIGEEGMAESIIETKEIGSAYGRRQYNRIIFMSGDMLEDSMTEFFKTCEGCVLNDCSKCRNIDCAGCQNDECEDTDKKNCEDCLILDCTDLLNYWGLTDTCQIDTEYGEANLTIEEFDDSIRITISDFSEFRDLEMMFTDGCHGTNFEHFFMSVSVDEKDYNGDYSSFQNSDVNPGVNSSYNNPYARYDAEDEATIIELREFLKNNNLQTQFYTMYSTWKQLYNKNNEELTEQEWLDRFGQYLFEDEF